MVQRRAELSVGLGMIRVGTAERISDNFLFGEVVVEVEPIALLTPLPLYGSRVSVNT